MLCGLPQVDHSDKANMALLKFNELWNAKLASNSLLIFSTGRSHKLFQELKVCHDQGLLINSWWLSSHFLTDCIFAPRQKSHCSHQMFLSALLARRSSMSPAAMAAANQKQIANGLQNWIRHGIGKLPSKQQHPSQSSSHRHVLCFTGQHHCHALSICL